MAKTKAMYKVFTQECNVKGIIIPDTLPEQIGGIYTARQATNMLFMNAKQLADNHNGDWQYSFETNNSSIYWYGDNGKELVARRGIDTNVFLQGEKIWIELIKND